jgi:replicative DNA helicase Mcm
MQQTLTEAIAEFYETYYMEEIAELAQNYPEQSWLEISHSDVWRHNSDWADDLRQQPDAMQAKFSEALELVDQAYGVALSDVSIRVTDMNETYVHAPGEIEAAHAGTYVGVEGVLDRVTTTDDLPSTIKFECERCSTPIEVEQNPTSGDLREPHECRGCERKGPFNPMLEDGEWSDYAKFRIEPRPDQHDAEGNIDGYVLDDMVNVGGENGLIGRAGEPMVAYGKIERRQKQGSNDLLFEHSLRLEGVEFIHDEETVDVEAHRKEFERLADRDDAVDIFADSIAPELHGTDALQTAFEFGVAYLFGAPRIDVSQGPTYRGDLHFLMITDYSMGKSAFMGDLHDYSPKSIKKSTTALGSNVGLTAAAVKDDFGEGQWTISPGLLVKANGGHLFLDEIDKGPDELTKMNDALEGDQMVDVEKAGQSATYESRTGVMAVGNPEDSRFDDRLSIASQMGIESSFLSRMDGIITMRDTADKEQDTKVARSFGKAYTEALEVVHGDREDLDTLERLVPTDVGKAWIKDSRENINPTLRYEQYQELEEWYAEEIRQLNKSFASDNGKGSDMPVPATTRDLAAAVKMSLAFARVHRRDEVAPEDIQRAKKLGKRLVEQNWNGEEFDSMNNMNVESQQDRVEVLKDLLPDSGEMAYDEIVNQAPMSKSDVDKTIESLSRQGEIMQPETDHYRNI